MTVRLAKDLTNHNLFIIKCNSNDSDSIDSIDTEAHLLSQLGPHKNIIQMYGAVLDIQKHTSLPNKIYKLMMELAECKHNYSISDLATSNLYGIYFQVNYSIFLLLEILTGYIIIMLETRLIKVT